MQYTKQPTFTFHAYCRDCSQGCKCIHQKLKYVLTSEDNLANKITEKAKKSKHAKKQEEKPRKLSKEQIVHTRTNAQPLNGTGRKLTVPLIWVIVLLELFLYMVFAVLR